MGQHRQQPQRVPAAALLLRGRGLPLRRLHLHPAQPQLPPPPPLLRRRRPLPAPARRRRHLRGRRRRGPPPPGPRRRLPQCRRVPAALLLRLQPRRRRRPQRARGRDVPRPRRGARHLGRRRRRGLRPPQEAPDQEPRVRGALPRAQAGLRPRAGDGGAAPAGGEREPPRQVRAAEGVRGGGGAGAGEEDPAEDAVRAILRTTARGSIDQSKQAVALLLLRRAVINHSIDYE